MLLVVSTALLSGHMLLVVGTALLAAIIVIAIVARGVNLLSQLRQSGRHLALRRQAELLQQQGRWCDEA